MKKVKLYSYARMDSDSISLTGGVATTEREAKLGTALDFLQDVQKRFDQSEIDEITIDGKSYKKLANALKAAKNGASAVNVDLLNGNHLFSTFGISEFDPKAIRRILPTRYVVLGAQYSDKKLTPFKHVADTPEEAAKWIARDCNTYAKGNGGYPIDKKSRAQTVEDIINTRCLEYKNEFAGIYVRWVIETFK